jgi:hypothetical protein
MTREKPVFPKRLDQAYFCKKTSLMPVSVSELSNLFVLSSKYPTRKALQVASYRMLSMLCQSMSVVIYQSVIDKNFTLTGKYFEGIF